MKTTTQVYYDPLLQKCFTRVWYKGKDPGSKRYRQKLKIIPTDIETAKHFFSIKHSHPNYCQWDYSNAKGKKL